MTFFLLASPLPKFHIEFLNKIKISRARIVNSQIKKINKTIRIDIICSLQQTESSDLSGYFSNTRTKKNISSDKQ